MARPILPKTTRDLKDGRVRLDLWLPAHLKEALRREAFELRRSASGIVEEMLAERYAGKLKEGVDEERGMEV